MIWLYMTAEWSLDELLVDIKQMKKFLQQYLEQVKITLVGADQGQLLLTQQQSCMLISKSSLMSDFFLSASSHFNFFALFLHLCPSVV